MVKSALRKNTAVVLFVTAALLSGCGGGPSGPGCGSNCPPPHVSRTVRVTTPTRLS